jgi:hypothetical protein
MRTKRGFAIALAVALLPCGSPAVFGDTGMTININNNTTTGLLVTVYDRNSNPAEKVLSGEKINSFAKISVSITPDESGHGHISWTAINLDPSARQCGHKDRPGLNDGDTVHVYANSDCPGN